MSAACHFYVINRDDPEDSSALRVRSGGRGWLVLDEPPAIGDLIALDGTMDDPDDPDGERLIEVSEVWRVIARCWEPASFGSQAWRTGDRQSDPVRLDVMLEKWEGIFAASNYDGPPAGGAR